MSSVPEWFHRVEDVLIYLFFLLHLIKTLFVPLVRSLTPRRWMRDR